MNSHVTTLEGSSASEKRQRLARLLQQQKQQSAQQAIPLRSASREGRLPLSSAQMRLWLLDQMEVGSSIYAIPATFHLTGTLHIALLEASINEIVRRHEALRTVFRHE